MFGSGFSGNLSFASLAKSASGSIFDSAHTQKAQAEFAAQAKSKVIRSLSNDFFLIFVVICFVSVPCFSWL